MLILLLGFSSTGTSTNGPRTVILLYVLLFIVLFVPLFGSIDIIRSLSRLAVTRPFQFGVGIAIWITPLQ